MPDKNGKQRQSTKPSNPRNSGTRPGVGSSSQELPSNFIGTRTPHNDAVFDRRTLAGMRQNQPSNTERGSGTVQAGNDWYGDDDDEDDNDIRDNYSTQAQGHAPSHAPTPRRAPAPHPFRDPRPDFQLAPGHFVNPGLAQTGYFLSNPTPFNAPMPPATSLGNVSARARGLGNQDNDARQVGYLLYQQDTFGCGDQFSGYQHPDHGNTPRYDFDPVPCGHGYQQGQCPWPGCTHRGGW